MAVSGEPVAPSWLYGKTGNVTLLIENGPERQAGPESGGCSVGTSGLKLLLLFNKYR